LKILNEKYAKKIGELEKKLENEKNMNSKLKKK